MFQIRGYQGEAIGEWRTREETVDFDMPEDDPTGITLGAPTGAGKAVIAAQIMMEEMVAGQRSMFVVDRLALMRQTSKAFQKFGLFHHVVHDKQWNIDPEFLPMCLIASSQTIEAKLRGKKSRDDMMRLLESVDLFIVDEAHSVRHFLKVVKEMRKRLLGLTATPLNPDMRDYYHQDVINVTTTKKLMEEKFLAQARVYIAKEKDQFDMAGAHTVAGEWTKDVCEERGVDIVGNIVDNWIERCDFLGLDNPKTIVFGPTVAYCNWLVEIWKGLGYSFEVLSYKEHPDDCADRIEAFDRGDIRGLVSCEKISKGFDVADVEVLVSARPYKKSVMSHIQQFGRLLRFCPHIDMKYVFDHSGNYQRFMSETRAIHTSGIKKIPHKKDKLEGGPAPTKVCPNCQCLLMLAATICPECGFEFQTREVTETAQEKGQVVWEELQLSDDFKTRERQRDYAERLKESEELQKWFALCALADELLPLHVSEHKKVSWCLAQFKAIEERWPRQLGRPYPFFPDMGVRMPEFEKEVRKNYQNYLAMRDLDRNEYQNSEPPPNVQEVPHKADVMSSRDYDYAPDGWEKNHHGQYLN